MEFISNMSLEGMMTLIFSICVIYLYWFYVRVFKGGDIKYIINQFHTLFNKIVTAFKKRYFY